MSPPYFRILQRERCQSHTEGIDRITEERGGVKKKDTIYGISFPSTTLPMAYSSLVTREYIACPREMECSSKATHLTALRA
jgi:hypothetical protein